MEENQSSLRSKFDEKRLKKRAEEHQRQLESLKKMGLSAEQAEETIARREYESAPIDQKVRRLEDIVARALQQLSQEMINLRANDQVLADAMDVNFRAVAKALTLAGIPLEKQGEIIKEVNEEVAREIEQIAEARRKVEEAAQKAEADKTEVAAVEQVADVAGVPPDAPAEATQFGG